MHAKSLQLCLTLCDPMDYNPPGSSVQEILQARILEWVAIFFSRDLPDTEIKPAYLMSPALAGGFFTIIAIWKAINRPSLLFFQDSSGYSGSLAIFFINFRIKLLTSTKIAEILIEPSLNLQTNLGNIAILIILSLQIHENGMFPFT